MRRLALVALALVLVRPAAGQLATWQFERGVDAFTQVAGAGEIAHETAAPLSGAGSLRLTLAEKASELRVVSPEFPVAPWSLYLLRLRRAGDLGTDLRLSVDFGTPTGWRPGSLFMTSGSTGLFGTFPESNRARLVLTLVVPGQALGRSVVLDEIRVQEQGPLIKESTPNLFWDGGFELARGDLTHWVTPPKVMEPRAERPRTGNRCLRVESERTYLVFPSVPVQPGRLYRFRAWVRGEGTVWPGLHKLAPSDWDGMRIDTAQRVGWAPPTVSEIVLTEEWQAVEVVTPCESERIVWFQPYLTFSGGALDVDDAELCSLDERE